MKSSRFNLWVKDYPSKGDYLVFNSRTQAIIKLNNHLKDVLDRLESIRPEDLTSEDKANITALKENGVVVESDKEEEKKIFDFFQQLKYESGDMAFEVTILTTYSCNFRCVYCFEESVKENVFLNKETSDEIIKWLKRTVAEKKIKRLCLVFYGGEPLLNIKPIYDISWDLHQWCQEKGVDFGFAIITNGSLLSLDLVEKFITVGLKEVRISIDGDRLHHDRNRPFIDGRPSFDIIINNIKSVIDKVEVGIAGNFDRTNIESIPLLLDYLQEESLLYKLQRIDFAPLIPRLGSRANPEAIELGECLSYIDKEGLYREVLGIKRELLRRGLKISTGLAINACALTMKEGAITIDPKGVFYKCNSLVGYPDFSIGNVREEKFNQRYYDFLGIDAWNKCEKSCPYIPMCQGGCRYFAYLENKNFSDLACKKEYLDNMVPELIKLEYDKLNQAV